MAARRKGRRGTKVAATSWRWPLIARWSLALLLFTLMGGSAAWGITKLADPRVLPLKLVRIDGDFRHLNRRDIEVAVGRAVQGNFFTLDVSAVRRAATRLPWVDQVSVRRVWPATLKMTVRERVPLARWGKQGLVTAEGATFQPAASELPKGLVRLAGPHDSAPQVVQRYLQMQQQLAPLGLRINRLQLDAREAWQVTLDDGVELWLGNRDVDRRLSRFMRVYPALRREQQRPVRFDMRYTNGMAVRWEALEPRQQNDQGAPAGTDSRGRV